MIYTGKAPQFLSAFALFIALSGISLSAASGTAKADTASLHSQIIQSGQQLLDAPSQNIKLADLQALISLAQRYFSSRMETEWPLLNQRLEDQRLHRYSDESLYEEQSTSVEEILIAACQRYISNQNGAVSSADLIRFRNLLRQLPAFDQGHLSGSTWLYNSPLPSFAAIQLQPLDRKIIQTALASADSLRKKHQYAAAEKIHQNLLTDYANTTHEAPIKILSDATIVEDYNYQGCCCMKESRMHC